MNLLCGLYAPLTVHRAGLFPPSSKTIVPASNPALSFEICSVTFEAWPAFVYSPSQNPERPAAGRGAVSADLAGSAFAGAAPALSLAAGVVSVAEAAGVVDCPGVPELSVVAAGAAGVPVSAAGVVDCPGEGLSAAGVAVCETEG